MIYITEYKIREYILNFNSTFILVLAFYFLLTDRYVCIVFD